jgi:hypothetical protein
MYLEGAHLVQNLAQEPKVSQKICQDGLGSYPRVFVRLSSSNTDLTQHLGLCPRGRDFHHRHFQGVWEHSFLCQIGEGDLSTLPDLLDVG